MVLNTWEKLSTETSVKKSFILSEITAPAGPVLYDFLRKNDGPKGHLITLKRSSDPLPTQS